GDVLEDVAAARDGFTLVQARPRVLADLRADALEALDRVPLGPQRVAVVVEGGEVDAFPPVSQQPAREVVLVPPRSDDDRARAGFEARVEDVCEPLPDAVADEGRLGLLPVLHRVIHDAEAGDALTGEGAAYAGGEEPAAGRGAPLAHGLRVVRDLCASVPADASSVAGIA